MKDTIDNVHEVASASLKNQVAWVQSDGDQVLDDIDSMLQAGYGGMAPAGKTSWRVRVIREIRRNEPSCIP